MSWYDLYQRRLTKEGTTNSGAYIASTIDLIGTTFSDSPNYYKITVGTTDYEIITVDGTDSTNKIILLMPDISIPCGTILTIDSDKWMVTDFSEHILFPKGKIQKCNTQIKWQKDNGIIEQLDCVLTNSALSRFSDAEKQGVIILDGNLYMYVPNNIISQTIKYSQRFIISKNAYEIISINDVLYNGLIQLVLKVSTLQEDDSITLGVANYIAPDYVLKIEDVSLTIQETPQLIPVLTNNNEYIDEEFIYSVADDTIATVSNTGFITPLLIGSTTIDIKWIENENIHKVINIDVVESVEDNMEVIIKGDNKITKNTSKRYQGNIINNGKPVEGTIVWSIVGNSAEIMTSESQYCTVKAINTGNITLIAKWQTNEMIKAELNIICEDLW